MVKRHNVLHGHIYKLCGFLPDHMRDNGVQTKYHLTTMRTTLDICRHKQLRDNGVCVLFYGFGRLLSTNTTSTSRHSDRSNDRFFHITFVQCISLVGTVIAISTMNAPARYVSL